MIVKTSRAYRRIETPVKGVIVNSGQLSVTEEQLVATIGRLHVENLVLRIRLAELEKALPGQRDGPGDGTPAVPAIADDDQVVSGAATPMTASPV